MPWVQDGTYYQFSAVTLYTVVRGSWFKVRGSRFVVRRSWFAVRGSPSQQYISNTLYEVNDAGAHTTLQMLS